MCLQIISSTLNILRIMWVHTHTHTQTNRHSWPRIYPSAASSFNKTNIWSRVLATCVCVRACSCVCVQLAGFSGGSQMEKSDRPTYGEVHQSHGARRHSFFIGWGVLRTCNLQQPAHLRESERDENEREGGRERETLVVGTVWTTAFSLLHFTPGCSSHRRGEEVGRRCGGGMWCGLFCSREKDGEIHSEDVIIIRLPCFGLTGGLKKKKDSQTHTKPVYSTYTQTSAHTPAWSSTYKWTLS